MYSTNEQTRGSTREKEAEGIDRRGTMLPAVCVSSFPLQLVCLLIAPRRRPPLVSGRWEFRDRFSHSIFGLRGRQQFGAHASYVTIHTGDMPLVFTSGLVCDVSSPGDLVPASSFPECRVRYHQKLNAAVSTLPWKRSR